jgi:hypothetical protein
MPIPFQLLAAALQESEKQGYQFVTQTMITIAPTSKLAIPTPNQQVPAFLVVFRSENTTPPDLSKIGLAQQK